jgi:hypothetical protein
MFFSARTRQFMETVDLEFQCKNLEILKSLNAASCVKYKGHKKNFVQANSDE